MLQQHLGLSLSGWSRILIAVRLSPKSIRRIETSINECYFACVCPRVGKSFPPKQRTNLSVPMLTEPWTFLQLEAKQQLYFTQNKTTSDRLKLNSGANSAHQACNCGATGEVGHRQQKPICAQ